MKGAGKLVGLGIVVIAFAYGLKEDAEEASSRAPAGEVESCPSLSQSELAEYMQAMETEDFETVQRFEQRC